MTTHTLIRCQLCGDPAPWHRESCPVLIAKLDDPAVLHEINNALVICDTRVAGYAEQVEV